jgi:hypothetical protein
MFDYLHTVSPFIYIYSNTSCLNVSILPWKGCYQPELSIRKSACDQKCLTRSFVIGYKGKRRPFSMSQCGMKLRHGPGSRCSLFCVENVLERANVSLVILLSASCLFCLGHRRIPSLLRLFPYLIGNCSSFLVGRSYAPVRRLSVKFHTRPFLEATPFQRQWRKERRSQPFLPFNKNSYSHHSDAEPCRSDG